MKISHILLLVTLSVYPLTTSATPQNQSLTPITDNPIPITDNPTPKKGTLYFAGGYNLDWFSKSTIHFKNNQGNDYDFKLHNLRAIDRDGLDELFYSDITIPQYSFRIGYFFNDKHNLGVEINYDHVKYVVVQNQKAHLTGRIHDQHYDQDTILTRDFVMFEHTNGANFAMVNIIKRHHLYTSPNQKHQLGYVLKAGFGFVYPKSDTRIMGKRLNDKYHVAGYVGGVESGMRYDFFKNFFFETTLKTCYAKYVNVRLPDNGKATHAFFSLEYIALIGVQFPL